VSVVLKVWGDYACFSRPDAGKVERFSYPIITPSAARAVFDAIYWKPKFRWRIERIELLREPQYISLMRNEVKDRANTDAMDIIRRDPTRAVPPLLADATPDEAGTDQKGRTQRQTMALKSVAYRIHAAPQLFGGDTGERTAILAQFTRRAKAGQCRWQPYLGCREFAAYFELLGDSETETDEPAAAHTETIGMMLYDVFDLTRPVPEDGERQNAKPFVTAFRAEIKDGVLEVPRFESEHVFKPGAVSGQQEAHHA
jgi:CRISPR-associated protein Cas5d